MKLDAVEDAREISLYPYEILIPGLGYPSTESAVLPGCKENDEPSYRGTTQALLTTPLDENIELVVGRVKAEEDAGGESIPRSWECRSTPTQRLHARLLLLLSAEINRIVRMSAMSNSFSKLFQFLMIHRASCIT